jgi:hypothetical protein
MAQVEPTAGSWEQPPDSLSDQDKMYWQLGRFIYHHNPYFKIEEFVADYAVKLYEARLGGQFTGYNSGYTWGDDPQNQGKDIPKPGDSGSRTWYFHVEKRPAEVNPTDPIQKPFVRNVVKAIELKYGKPVKEHTQEKLPHIIILYAGGNGT